MAYEMLKVLLVDDQENIRRLYNMYLNSLHYQVVAAQDGEQALNLAFSENPDVVLLDVMMPHMNGYEVCARLRSAPSTANIPVIIITSLSEYSARKKALDVGADDFITKDEGLEVIDGRIKMLIKKRMLTQMQSWLSELPGSAATSYALRKQMASGDPFAVFYFDLIGLDSYNKLLGYEEGERLLWLVARLLQNLARERNCGDFVGYLGADDFVLLTDKITQLESVADTMLRAFQEGVGSLGQMIRLAISIVIVQDGKALHHGEVASLGQALLREAKGDPEKTLRIGAL